MPEQMAQCLETKTVSHQCAESPISALSTYHHHMRVFAAGKASIGI
jgi:hypothetical protein